VKNILIIRDNLVKTDRKLLLLLDSYMSVVLVVLLIAFYLMLRLSQYRVYYVR